MATTNVMEDEEVAFEVHADSPILRRERRDDIQRPSGQLTNGRWSLEGCLKPERCS